ncbi:hypothetical protein [Acidithiobacillus ferrivorans]|nr:hypothetical protein [Acidithiobacillus ferrivorans]
MNATQAAALAKEANRAAICPFMVALKDNLGVLSSVIKKVGD